MSTVRADNVAPSAGGTSRSLPRGVAAAWINWNGVGAVAIRDSVNETSVTDHGVGDYTLNHTNAFANANYSSLSGSDSPGLFFAESTTARTASTIRIRTLDTANALADYTANNIGLFGSLA